MLVRQEITPETRVSATWTASAIASVPRQIAHTIFELRAMLATATDSSEPNRLFKWPIE
jgi:hypothetical protein